MLTVTKAAGGYLSAALDKANAPAESAVRILVKPEGLRTAIDQERDGDQSFEHDGRKVLLLDEQAANELSERTLDVEDDGKKLVCLT